MVHETTRIREDILEKDYYVTLLLKELSEKQRNLPAYFKGGTALYKALKSIRRFSEDIDITVCIEDCSSNQAKTRLENATKKYKSLTRTKHKEFEDDRKGSITTVYDYEPFVTVDEEDLLQRFGHVKVEATSFTVSEPYVALEIEPIIFTHSTKEQKQILSEQYGVVPFFIHTIRLERIFADKIFAAEFYYNREMYFDVAKHVYDVGIMLALPTIQIMLENKEAFLQMLGYKRLEETRRTGSDLANRPFEDFRLLNEIGSNNHLIRDYEKMQKNYVYSEKDILSFEYITNQWNKLKEILLKL